MESKIIRKIIFNFDNRDSYRYDVNQSVKIGDLKKLLETALQIPRFKIRLYSENVEYTALDETKLENLFPNINEIPFQVSFHPMVNSDKREKEIAIKLKLGQYCKFHENKYPCHFCFDCNESFCSICHKNAKHSDHETIEKYDYLMDANMIVERIFKKVTDEVQSLRFDNQDQISQLENKIKGNFYDAIRNLLLKIEDKARELLRLYSDINISSLKEIDENLKKVKSSCCEALVNKKEELQMQNIIIDESVVISYYNTILQIHNQKEPLNKDILKFIDLLKSYNHINVFVENVTKQINQMLEATLNNNEPYVVCEKEIRKNEIKPIDLETVKTVLYKDILNSTTKKPMSNSKYLNLTPCNNHIHENSAIKSIGKFHHLEDGYAPINNINFSEKRNDEHFMMNKYIENNISKNEIEKFQNENTTKKNSNNIMNTNVGSSNNQSRFEEDMTRDSNASLVNRNHSETISPNILNKLSQQEKKIVYGDQAFKVTFNVCENNDLNVTNNEIFDKSSYENVIYRIIPGTKNLLSYNENSQLIKKISIRFPFASSAENFLKNSSYINVNKKIYISGGTLEGTPGPSNQFCFYDKSCDSLKILPNLKEARENHSMIAYNNNIYIVGGAFTSCIEIYDLEKSILEQKPYIEYQALDNPILFVYKNFLYSFFGRKNGRFINTIRRVNLNSKNFAWEKYPYKKSDINLNVTNSGVILLGDNELLFFGGKSDDGISKEVFSFNFESKEFKKIQIELNEPQYFNNSQFIQLENSINAIFSDKDECNLLKISLNFN